MFGSWFNSRSATIGVDVGRSAVKFAQIDLDEDTPRLIASASVEVPAAQRATATGPLETFEQCVDEALASNPFRGRRAMLGLPASYVHIDRLRLAPMLTDGDLARAVTYESIDRLPFHPSRAKLRHHLAGLVYEKDEQRSEVLVMAVRQDVTERLLSVAAKAKLDVVGLRPEPMALAEAFARCGSDRGRAIVDIGHGSARLYIACGARIEFARSIGIGWQHLCPRADSADEKPQDTESAANASEARRGASTSLLAPAAVAAARARGTATTTQDFDALRRLARELSLSLHYHAETFPASPVGELVFVGGASLHRKTCQHLAAALGLTARPADLVSLSPDAPARPDLAVAICLSLATPDGNG